MKEIKLVTANKRKPLTSSPSCSETAQKLNNMNSTISLKNLFKVLISGKWWREGDFERKL